MPSMYFIDVSHWQGTIDFKKVRSAGCLGVIAKATEGVKHEDENYQKYRADALANGLAVASYHYLQHGSCEDQMAWYIARATPRQGERVVIDFEETSPAVTADDLKRSVLWLRENRPDLQLTIYGASMLTDVVNRLNDISWLAETSLWAARYSSNEPKVAKAWSTWTAWQYSDEGKIAGIAGDVDLNTFNGSKENCLKWFGPVGQEPAPPPEPEPAKPVVIVNIQAPTGVEVMIHLNGEVVKRE